MRSTLLPTLVAGVSLLALAATAPASADISVAGGGFASTSPTTAGGAVMVSTGASIPHIPIELQGTALVPLAQNGGYVVLGEIRGLTGAGFGGAYVGAGAGVGNLSISRTPGLALSAFAGKAVLPNTSIEIRIIKQTQTGGATAGFLGLRFTF